MGAALPTGQSARGGVLCKSLSLGLLMIVSLALTLAAASAAPPPAVVSLQRSEGWRGHAVKSTAYGPVDVWWREIDGVMCFRASFETGMSPGKIVDVIVDVEAAPSWGSGPMPLSEVLDRGPHHVDYVQLVDLPGWMLAQDRYWIMRAQREELDDGGVELSWSRIEEGTYDDVRFRVLRDYDDPLEIASSYGSWRFTQASEAWSVVYNACTDPGGSAPPALQRWSAYRSVPKSVEGLLTETRRRR